MSQNTRCPSCATLFKVVADQLRISDGWVRCGQCQQIFDAAANMQAVPEPALLTDFDGLPGRVQQPCPEIEKRVEAPTSLSITPPAELPLADEAHVLDVPEPVVPAFLIAPANPKAAAPDSSAPALAWPSAPAALVSEPSLPESESGSGSESGSDFEWLEEYEAAPTALKVLEQPIEPASALFEEVPSDFFAQLAETPAELIYAEPEPEPEPEPQFFAPPPLDKPAEAKEAKEAEEAEEVADWAASLELSPDPQSRIEPVLHQSVGVGAAAKTTPEADAQPILYSLPEDSSEPSFVRTARRQAFWRQLEVRASLVLLSLLLVVMLALQVAVHQRNYLAAAQPQWHPFLQTLCAPFQCKVAPYRDISSVVIDSSSFNKLPDDTYQFAVVLKNTSSNALETPAVELTLTNAQEQTVLRRVFTRKDLSAPRTLSAHGDWSTTLKVELDLSGAPIAGYRVLAFYP